MSVFTAVAFTAFDVPVTWTEVVGDTTGAASVYLTVRRHVLNWPVGLVNVVAFAVLFQQYKLYADAFLQLVFFGQGLFGWWLWKRGGTATLSGSTRVHRTTGRQWTWLLGGGLVTFAAVWTLLASTDDAAPLRDASVLALSLVATYGQAKALVESWWIWIVTDVISIPLYVTQKLYPTAILYGLFLAMCVAGLVSWVRQARTQDALALAA